MAAPAAPGPLALATSPLPPSADPYHVYLNGLKSSESRRAMRRCLDRLAVILLGEAEGLPGDPEVKVTGAGRAWWLLRYEHAASARSALLDLEWPATSINQYLTALRRVLEEAWRLGYMTTDQWQRAVDIKDVKGHREPAGRTIHPDEMAAMFKVCLDGEPPNLIGLRDAAMLAVLHSTGMRREEVATGLVTRYDPASRTLRIIGKGDKERTGFIHPTAALHLDRWLTAYGARRGPMFPPVGRWGEIRAAHMTPRAVGKRVTAWQAKAGIPPLSCHDFRKTFAGMILDAGLGVEQLKVLMGHEKIETTVLYDLRPLLAMQAFVDQLAVPLPLDNTSF